MKRLYVSCHNADLRWNNRPVLIRNGELDITDEEDYNEVVKYIKDNYNISVLDVKEWHPDTGVQDVVEEIETETEEEKPRRSRRNTGE